MAIKKYKLVKLLCDFNKKYNTNYSIKPSILNPILLYNCEEGTFHIKYETIHPPSSLFPISVRCLDEFIRLYIDSYLFTSSFVDFVLAKEDGNLSLKIKILPSSKIRYAYLYTNYFSAAGQLGKSCMRSKEMQKSLNFYIKNNVKIVVAVDGKNKIHARALLWEGVKSIKLKNPLTYLDRIYTISESVLPLFYDLAKRNKWHRYPSTSIGKAQSIYYIDNIDIKDICHLPYTDTFRYLYFKDGFITSNTNNAIKQNIKHLNSYMVLTNVSAGGYFPEIDANRVQEAITGKYISKKDGVYVKRYKAFVLRKNIVDIDGSYYSKYDKEITESGRDGFIFVKNSTNEVLTNEIIDKTKAIHSSKYNGFVHKSNVVHIKNEIYHTKDTDIVCLNTKWYHISQCFRNYDRRDANKELAKLPLLHTDLQKNHVLHTSVTVKDSLIPKDCTIIMYDLVYNPMSNSIEWQKIYCTDKRGFIQLVTGELIISSSENRQYLKKFNNKYYIKQELEFGDITVTPKATPATFCKPNKNQSVFSFMKK